MDAQIAVEFEKIEKQVEKVPESAAKILDKLPETQEVPDPEMKLNPAVVEMGLGSSLLASQTSMSIDTGTKMWIHSLGVIALNSKGRKVLVPWANIRCIELADSVRKSKSRRK
jgi:hypothetical protein